MLIIRTKLNTGLKWVIFLYLAFNIAGAIKLERESQPAESPSLELSI